MTYFGAEDPHLGERIGILGGSFNPAHDGHIEVSLLALDKLALDKVWWMVSPQNPLKSPEGMETFQKRILLAERTAKGYPICVSTVEFEMGTQFTVDSLMELVARFPKTKFIWLMGADNLAQIHRWRDWSRIFHTLPIAVFARPTYAIQAERGKAARRFARYRVPAYRSKSLAEKKPPAWVVFKGPHNTQSATRIRHLKKAGKG
ncbi:MAG: nicotinic acid mononucleotide adenylyltransferase [Rhodospirillaceae bacterium TMED8]|nr:nicotinic acid mononucleotide adenylyltransferase [Magnetovibrio sp.]OUT49287.1 MAG: nicotinic acid mononucleotide adenylyltransferase [Rhodospirillaceae bacterium TMED8]|tara:strand:- start:1837 stop:2448 length:612 start_codon:yes stop_codon:yes gene_type:complete